MDLKKFLKNIKLQESTISMVLGILVVLIIGYLAVNYIRQRDISLQNPLKIGNEQTTSSTSNKEHTVGENETLWSISEKYYGSGFNWTKIRDANNITDPNQIEKGQKLTIPQEESNDTRLASGVTVESKTETATKATPTNAPIVNTIQNTSKDTAPATSETKHKVVRGENLWVLAEKYYNDGFEWKKIAQENQIKNPSVLEVGQEITIKQPIVHVASAMVESDSTNKLSDESTYTVQKGDSLWSIAVGVYGDGNRWTDIAQVNSLRSPSTIHRGNVLKLPDAS